MIRDTPERCNCVFCLGMGVVSQEAQEKFSYTYFFDFQNTTRMKKHILATICWLWLLPAYGHLKYADLLSLLNKNIEYADSLLSKKGYVLINTKDDGGTSVDWAYEPDREMKATDFVSIFYGSHYRNVYTQTSSQKTFDSIKTAVKNNGFIMIGSEVDTLGITHNYTNKKYNIHFRTSVINKTTLGTRYNIWIDRSEVFQNEIDISYQYPEININKISSYIIGGINSIISDGWYLSADSSIATKNKYHSSPDIEDTTVSNDKIRIMNKRGLSVYSLFYETDRDLFDQFLQQSKLLSYTITSESNEGDCRKIYLKTIDGVQLNLESDCQSGKFIVFALNVKK